MTKEVRSILGKSLIVLKQQAAKGVVYGKEKSAKHRSKTFLGIGKAMAEQWMGTWKEEES